MLLVAASAQGLRAAPVYYLGAMSLARLPRQPLGRRGANLWTHAVIMCGHFGGVQTYATTSIDGETRGQSYLRQMLGSASISGGR